jgi:hypothetical protein
VYKALASPLLDRPIATCEPRQTMAEKDSRQVEPLPAMDDLKENPPLTKRDVDIGQMLEMDVSPAEERNVLLKLDLLYELPLSCQ